MGMCTKITKADLELLRDVDMILKWQNTNRVRIARAICHYAEANIKHLHDFDETKESTYIQYLDFNNQYGSALSQPISYATFEYAEDVSMSTDAFIII